MYGAEYYACVSTAESPDVHRGAAHHGVSDHMPSTEVLPVVADTTPLAKRGHTTSAFVESPRHMRWRRFEAFAATLSELPACPHCGRCVLAGGPCCDGMARDIAAARKHRPHARNQRP